MQYSSILYAHPSQLLDITYPLPTEPFAVEDHHHLQAEVFSLPILEGLVKTSAGYNDFFTVRMENIKSIPAYLEFPFFTVKVHIIFFRHFFSSFRSFFNATMSGFGFISSASICVLIALSFWFNWFISDSTLSLFYPSNEKQ